MRIKTKGDERSKLDFKAREEILFGDVPTLSTPKSSYNPFTSLT